jgi:hypothetical protein
LQTSSTTNQKGQTIPKTKPKKGETTNINRNNNNKPTKLIMNSDDDDLYDNSSNYKNNKHKQQTIEQMNSNSGKF